MFEIEVVENIPLTKVIYNSFQLIEINSKENFYQVSRGNRVKKKKMIKIKEFLRDNIEEKLNHDEIITKWTKIEVVIPTGMKYRWG